jgi:hypothetical protein
LGPKLELIGRLSPSGKEEMEEVRSATSEENDLYLFFEIYF